MFGKPALEQLLQRVQGKGLGQVIVHSCGKAALTVPLQCIGGERDNDRVSGRHGLLFMGADQPRGRQAIHFRHVTIHENQIKCPMRRRLDRLFALLRHGGRASQDLEHCARDLAVHRIVFCQEDMPGQCSRLFGRLNGCRSVFSGRRKAKARETIFQQ